METRPPTREPNEIIIARARELGVPMISVHFDTLTTVEKLESVLGRIRIRGERKGHRAQAVTGPAES